MQTVVFIIFITIIIIIIIIKFGIVTHVSGCEACF